MKLTIEELNVLREAVCSRLESDFDNEDVAGDTQICSPAHESELKGLLAKLNTAITRAESPVS